MRAWIALEDGTVFEGTSFGAAGERSGEVVFNTSLTGYQEILTDPSYKGQIVTMTYPLIGNYGINKEDRESLKPSVEGFVVRERSRIASNWRSKRSLEGYLAKNQIMGIEGVDTRALTRHIRIEGALRAVISTVDSAKRRLIEKARSSPGLVGRDLVREVTASKTYSWSRKGALKVAVIDCGAKYNIMRSLVARGCAVRVFPYSTDAAEIRAEGVDGVMLSNGPGDPAAVPFVVDTVKELLGKVPVFGICLGHQMLGQALGATTYKLKFGHHGGNHPVKDLRSGRISITVQNHGFCVDIGSLRQKDIEITHMNLNDKTLEGIRHRKLPAFSVQFHPEACPGPHDAAYLFDEFIALMKKHKRSKRR